MSIAGVLASGLFSGIGSQKVQNTLKQMQSKVGLCDANIKSGNTSNTQSAFASLHPGLMEQDPGRTPSSITPQQRVAQPDPGLTLDGLSAAAGGFSTIQGGLPLSHVSHSKIHWVIQTSGGDGNPRSTISELLSQIDPSLQSTNLSAAQQVYSSLQQNLSSSSVNSLRLTGATFAVDA